MRNAIGFFPLNGCNVDNNPHCRFFNRWISAPSLSYISCRLSSSRYVSYETTSLIGESNARFGSSPGTIVRTSMAAWYVGTVRVRGTCGFRDSSIVSNCVWTFVRASNVKGFGAICVTGCAIGGAAVGAARGAFRRSSVFVWTDSFSTGAGGGAPG